MSTDRARRLFRDAFGTNPVVMASAPGRVNLIGEHIDYNGGPVLPMAISARTWVAARPRLGTTSRVTSQEYHGVAEFLPRSPTAAGAWWDYVAGASRALAEHGCDSVPADIAVSGDVPRGSGLSSSAALEVATVLALAALAGCELAAAVAAQLAHEAERRFVGVNVGIMDQMASAVTREGHALLLDCATLAFEHVPMRERVLVFDTRVPRELRRSAYGDRRAECERALGALRRIRPGLATLADATLEDVGAASLPPVLERRARHVVTETARVRQAAADMRRGRPLDGELVLASHASLRDDYDCSCAELDWVVDAAMSIPGIRGARLTGAGWGGCAIVVGDPGALDEAAERLPPRYAARFGHGGAAWVTTAGAGARLEEGRG